MVSQVDLEYKKLDDDLLNDNRFISLATELYDIKVLKSIKNDPDNYEKITIKNGIFGKSEQTKEYKPEKEFYKKLEEFIRINLNQNVDTPVQFNIIWEFCQFVRWAEKAVFYENDLNNRVIVDSGMTAGITNNDPRVIVFQSQSTSTTIKLELKKEKLLQTREDSVFDLNTMETVPNRSHIITLEVIRNFGKKMKSKYIIVDGQVKYNDLSDIYLMNTVNRIIKDGIVDVFREILFSIETEDTFKDFNTDTDEEIKNLISSHFS